MNEAENPNNKAANESLNNPNSLQSEEQVTCPFYSVIPHQNMEIPQLPPAVEPVVEPVDNQPSTINIDTNQPESDWVAEPDSEKQALIDAEFQKLLDLNKDLRADNDDLYHQVEELKQVLAETQEALQLQNKRSSVSESMLNQQTQELSAAQEQIKNLFAELDSAVQTAQRQESLAESYKAHLELSQQRLAQLERECAIIQTNYDEQSHRLLQSENVCRELRTRLMRQQRQTLQFKAALEKCLDAPVPTGDFLEDVGGKYYEPDNNSKFSQVASSVFSHKNPIQPWSADSESGTDNLNQTWEELCLLSSDDIEATIETETGATQVSNWEFDPTLPGSSTTPSQQESSTEDDESNVVATTDTAADTATDAAADAATYDISTLGHPWDEKLDRAIQDLLGNQNLSTSLELLAQSESNHLADNNENHSPFPRESEWESGATSVVDNQGTDEPIVPIVETIADGDISIAPIVETIAETATDADVQTEDYWSDVPQVSPFEVIETAKSDNLWDEYADKQDSPSPVIYPERPPKGRKSLASVELPNFKTGKDK